MIMEAVWRDIDGYVGFYQISSTGLVRSVDRYVLRKDGRTQLCKGRILSFFKGTTCNYLSVQICRDNIPQKFLVHRLVAKAFLGLTDDTNLEVNHKDGNRFNNCVENLEVVTHQQNINHSVLTNLKRDYGENHVHAKLTNQQAKAMREMWNKGVKQVDIAKLFGVSNKLVHRVVNYKSYLR